MIVKGHLQSASSDEGVAVATSRYLQQILWINFLRTHILAELENVADFDNCILQNNTIW